MKLHFSHIYYYINRNIYFSHILSKKIVKRLTKTLNKYELYIVHENRIKNKLYTLFRKNIDHYLIKLNQNKDLINQLVIQINENIKSNMFNFRDEEYKIEVNKKNTGYYLDEQVIHNAKKYLEKHRRLKNININYFMCYFLDLNIQISLNKIDILLFLEQICNKKTNNI